MKKIKVLGLMVFVILAMAACTPNVKVEENKGMKDDMKHERKESETKDGEMKNGENKDEVNSETQQEKLNKGEFAKAFTLKEKDGSEVTLSSLKGKKTYIKFWASWCSVCLAGLEELNELAAQDNEFEIITVVSPGFRGEKNEEEFVKWFETLEYKNVRVLFDENGEMMNQFGVRAFPTSVYLGSDGVHVKTRLGHLPNEMVVEDMSTIQ